jgi:hypothetical protein
MRFQKLLISAVTVCVLVGVSSAAMAQEIVGCPDGVIENTTVDSIVIKLGSDCIIQNVVVLGDVTISNTMSASVINNQIGGNVDICQHYW